MKKEKGRYKYVYKGIPLIKIFGCKSPEYRRILRQLKKGDTMFHAIYPEMDRFK